MKFLVKFELKFLNFFTLKNLNNKKIYFLLPKKQLCTAVSGKMQIVLGTAHNLKFVWYKAN